jgi:Mg-chelatase subunit ChlD
MIPCIAFARRGGTALLAGLLWAGVAAAEQAPAKARPRVEVVFVLDTTGSMGNLINAAKQRIWAISNQIAGGQPTPELKVGLIAYRDRGDDYVTRIYDLTDDLDAIHQHLLGLKAAGGGDFPEAVNQALHEAVTKISWTKDKMALKIIFLVGDAPPKQYADEVPFEQTCQTAVRNDIIINSIQCGNHLETQMYWKKICHLSEGAYVQIDGDGGQVVVVKTPFDDDLARINAELTKSTLTYGPDDLRKKAEEKKDAAAKLPDAEAADRAGWAAKSGKAAAYDLLDSIKAGKVKLEGLKKEELPTPLQNLTLPMQKKLLQKIEVERESLQKQAVELDKKRQAYINKELNEKAKGFGYNNYFDQQVFQILQDQARRVDIQYGAPPPATKKK